MKKGLLILTFLLCTLSVNALTKFELIKTELGKLGVAEEVINETLVLDFEIGDSILRGTGNEYIPRLEEVLKKNNKNFIVLDHLAIYGIKNKTNFNYVDEYIKYVPYNYEKDFTKAYKYNAQNETEKGKKELENIKKKYKGQWQEAWASLGDAKTFEERKNTYEKVLPLLKEAKKDDKNGITDELYFYISLTYYDNVMGNYIKENKIQELIDYFTVNVANNEMLTDEMALYYKDTLIALFNVTYNYSQTLENDTDKSINKEKLKNTKLYQIMSKYFDTYL